ncbi:MAG: prepilin-type N-terminal cleavage/methylation domain-containing protein [Acidaminococcaceae bacterium]
MRNFIQWLQRFKSNKSGFTLIEIMAVLAIIGMLVTMMMPSIDEAVNRTKNTKMASELVTVDSAIKLYQLENNNLPTTLTDLKDYLPANKIYKDAKNQDFVYSKGEGEHYTLTGTKTNGDVVQANGKKPDSKL